MPLYLSDYKKFIKSIVTQQGVGPVTIDSFSTSGYSSVKYNLVIEDIVNKSTFTGTFTVVHDGASVISTGYDIVDLNDMSPSLDVVLTTVVNGYPTLVDVMVTLPTGFDGKIMVEKEVYINEIKDVRDGFDGPSSGLFPSPYTYPNNI